MDDLDILLLSIVHKGDADSLKTQLLTASDPNIYLNRLYDEPNEQKCTLLMIACLSGYDDMLYMILDYFKPNLEILNSVQIYDNDKMSEVYHDVTILWAAAAINHFLIVKQLVEYGANVNSQTSTHSTALRCVCYNGNIHMARYLVANGADIHISKDNNDTNLILSAYRGHFQMTVYLVNELGLDVNDCDSYGRSPLYSAVEYGSIEIVRFLLDHDARNYPATYNQFSPLMLAAEKRRSDLVDIISMYCSNLEWIEAEELLGSAFASGAHGSCNLQQSFEHFYRALELRSIHNLPKLPRSITFEIFNNRQECDTIEQLKELRLNAENMYIEALLVRERLLGITNEKYHYSILYRGAILADNGQYDRGVAYWLYELELQQQCSIVIDSQRLRRFSSIFSQMVYESLPISTDAILTVMAVVVSELKKHNVEQLDDNLYTALFLTTIVSQSSVNVLLRATDVRKFYQLLSSIHKARYMTHKDGSSLLQLALSNTTAASDSFIDNTCKYPCLHTTRILLKCGANINSINNIRDTPLHTYVRHSDDYNDTILQLLCDAGAHLDWVNASGATPADIAINPISKQFLRNKMQFGLKCLCARLIRRSDIPYHGIISTSLVDFVDKH